MNDYVYLSKKAEKFATLLPTLDIRDLRALAIACQHAIDAAIGEVRKVVAPAGVTNGFYQSGALDASKD